MSNAMPEPESEIIYVDLADGPMYELSRMQVNDLRHIKSVVDADTYLEEKVPHVRRKDRFDVWRTAQYPALKAGRDHIRWVIGPDD